MTVTGSVCGVCVCVRVCMIVCGSNTNPIPICRHEFITSLDPTDTETGMRGDSKR